MKTKQMAARLAQLGRGGDTLLAHITPREAAMLKRAGGSGTINPKTGLPEFFDDSGDSFSWSPPSSGGQGFSAPAAESGGYSPAPSEPGFSFDNTPSTPAADPSAGSGNFFGGTQISSGGAFQNSPFEAGGFNTFAEVPGFSQDSLPAPTNSYDLPAPTYPGQEGSSNYLTDFFKRLASAKAWQLGAKALGVPGVAMGLIGPAKAAWDAPEGKRMEAFIRSLGMGQVNSGLNQATGGMYGALGGPQEMARLASANPNAQPPAGGNSRYDPSIDYARGAAGLYGAYKFNQLGKGSDSEREAENRAADLIRNPGSVVNMPGFAAGKQAVERAAAGRGYLGSGNLTVALAKYGDSFYNNALNSFSNIASRNAGVRQNYNLNSTALALQSLGSLGYGYARQNRLFDAPTPYQAPADLQTWEG